MATLPEPDDVDIVVSSGGSDPKSRAETTEFIRQYKQRPEFPSEVLEARKRLDALGIKPETYGLDDPQALFAHWKRCVEDLERNDSKPTNGRPS